jgi:uncharacterized membrane protein
VQGNIVRLAANRGIAIAVALVLSLGVVLRLVQYFAATSLWYDEIALARSIVGRPIVTLLTEPLEFQQVAPIGFVVTTKVATLLFGPIELGLRVVPLLAGLATLVLFWLVAVRFISGPALAGALLLMAVSPASLWYGGNVKPYAGDVAATLLLVWLALRYMERPDDIRRALAAGLAGGVATFLSFPGVLTAGAIAAVLSLWWSLQRPRMPVLAATIGPWLAGAAATGLIGLALIVPSTREYMVRFWADGFMPRPWWSLEALLWAPGQLFRALGVLLLMFVDAVPGGSIYVGVCAVAAVVGMAVCLRRSPWIALVVLAPTVAAAVGGMLHVLPFSGRVGLAAAWPMLVLALAAVQAVATGSRMRQVAAAAVGTIIVAVPSLIVLGVARPPYRAQEARPVLAEVARLSQPGDVFFSYYGARQAVAFYGPLTGLTDWTIGGCHREAPIEYFRELDRFRGEQRVWFFSTHAALGYREPEVIRAYLATIGTLRYDIADPFGASGQEAATAALFDLSDPARLRTATAETFVHEPVATGGPRILCDGTRLEPTE